jgi:hypothetical protein
VLATRASNQCNLDRMSRLWAATLRKATTTFQRQTLHPYWPSIEWWLRKARVVAEIRAPAVNVFKKVADLGDAGS